jgi:hypothetical protein
MLYGNTHSSARTKGFCHGIVSASPQRSVAYPWWRHTPARRASLETGVAPYSSQEGLFNLMPLE